MSEKGVGSEAGCIYHNDKKDKDKDKGREGWGGEREERNEVVDMKVITQRNKKGY